ncbi:MAG: WYL domain-containing protein [Clostridia bacterium]|nr:WYL domain-containing protein [Clostridia bacterium]
MSLEPKKTVIFRLYQILFDYTDADHPMTQAEIQEKLRTDYGIEAERKSIGRNLSYLQEEMKMGIVSSRKGTYLEDRPFEPAELRLLIDCVLSSRYIKDKYSDDLIKKLSRMGGRYFQSRVRHIFSVHEWGNRDNDELFLNIDLIDEAIESGRQITFTYNRLDADKKPQKTHRHIVSPYQMIVHNQRYYLMGYSEYWKDIRFYRIDKMTEAKVLTKAPATPIRTLPGYENGVNYSELANTRPYMYSDKPEHIILKTREAVIDELVDWFGPSIGITPQEGDTITVDLMASPTAMMYWALQFGDDAEILAPLSLRNRVQDMLKTILAKYEAEP